MSKWDGKTYEQRFWERVDKSGPYSKVCGSNCWNWTAGKSGRGYGYFTINNRGRQAYKVAYEWLVGPVPPGFELHHLCENPLCVNPSHLQPLTRHDHLLRGNSFVAVNGRKTECKRGHPFVGNNYRVNVNGARVCRICAAESQRKFREKRNAM